MFSSSNIKLLVSSSNVLYETLTHKKEKNLILDPLSCIIRLVVLAYKPYGTKISIYSNKISYHEPNIFQGVIRWSNGDNRNDLHNLHNPILKALEWFVLNNVKIDFIFRKSIEGIQKFMESYNKNSVVYHSLKHYSDIIENNLSTNLIDDENYITEINDIDNSIYKNLLNLWNNNDIIIIYNLILEIDTYFKNKDDININNYINLIEQFLINKDNNVFHICLEKSTIL